MNVLSEKMDLTISNTMKPISKFGVKLFSTQLSNLVVSSADTVGPLRLSKMENSSNVWLPAKKVTKSEEEALQDFFQMGKKSGDRLL